MNTIQKIAQERPNYFMCSKSSVPWMLQRARKEVEELLTDFRRYFSGTFSVDLRAVECGLCWKICATLKVNDKVCREYEELDFLFIDLNQLMLNRAKKELSL